jgi:hypothetical protein
MRSAIACVAAALALEHASVMARSGGDSTDNLRACASMPIAERTRCLYQRSHSLGPEPAPSRSADSTEGAASQENWVISETTSPIDYSPVIIATAMATATAAAPSDSGMKLSISCRGENTSFVLGSPAGLPSGARYVVWYTIDGSSAKALPAAATSSGLALSGDVVGFLLSLPAQGEIRFRIAGRDDMMLEGRYSLAGLKTIRERMAVPCKWPPRAGSPRK